MHENCNIKTTMEMPYHNFVIKIVVDVSGLMVKNSNIVDKSRNTPSITTILPLSGPGVQHGGDADEPHHAA